VKLGFFLCTQDPPRAERIVEVWQENLNLVEIADQCGLDLVGVGEHHFRDDAQMPAPLVAAAAMAARTSHIGIVTTVSIGTLWQPLRLAEEAAVVDVLSGGRFTLGLGLGNFAPELAAFGIEKRHQAPVFEEVLDIVSTALTGERFRYDGRFFTVPELRVTPQPVQQPFPLWLGGMSTPGVSRAARYGSPLLLDPLHTVEELLPWVARYREACAEHGTQPQVKLLRYGWVSEDADEADELWWPFMREQFWNYAVVVPRFNADASEALLRGATGPEELQLAAFAEDRMLVGDPVAVAAQARDMTERLGADTLIVKMQGERGPWGEPMERALRALSGPVREQL
jgi:alkanesulfonate monooxygenase SsuD/methylene tetrahydromethanopterin reductase-like flavin-dependent oxidoreductase (luciferase family)